MYRHPALRDLSRDHFVALNHVVDIRRVVQGERFARPEGDVLRAYAGFVSGELDWHFREEEELLLPLLAAPLAKRMRREHAALRAGWPGVGALAGAWENAQALRDHARWEEEEAFPWLQEHMDEAALERLEKASHAFRLAHRGPDAIGPHA